jgi:putative glycerol-1-phosphate prenyltransferase
MNLLKKQLRKKNQIAILLDPEKEYSINQFISWLSRIDQFNIDYIFVGGSTSTRIQIENAISLLKKNTTIPVIIFPGSPEQFSVEADGILFLNLISGRNLYYLIESQIQAAEDVYNSGITSISTSYILIDGKNESSVAKISNTEPINANNLDLIYKTALAGKLIGHEATYLEAGSGAKEIIPLKVVEQISQITDLLIVGGGIHTDEQIYELHNSGANIVVIGNHIEKNPEFLNEILNYKNQHPTR